VYFCAEQFIACTLRFHERAAFVRRCNLNRIEKDRFGTLLSSIHRITPRQPGRLSVQCEGASQTPPQKLIEFS
jgi:hypothetical protein